MCGTLVLASFCVLATEMLLIAAVGSGMWRSLSYMLAQSSRIVLQDAITRCQ